MNGVLVAQPKKMTASDRLLSRLEEAILNREYAPGSRLPAEREVQEQLGVGRGTVRAAYRSLQEKGLIEIRRGGGAYVQEVDSSKIGGTLSTLIRHQQVSYKHLMEFREIFESRTAAYAVERATGARIRDLRKSVEELEKYLLRNGSDTEFFQMELNLHVELARISKNPLFEWIATAFQQNSASYSRNLSTFLEYTSDMHAREVIEDWRQLLDAMEKGEALRASVIMTNHTYRFARLLQGLDSMEYGDDEQRGSHPEG